MGGGQYDSNKDDHCQKKIKKTTTRKGDGYDVIGFDDFEDFYEEYYNDFMDNEDAEDCWEGNS